MKRHSDTRYTELFSNPLFVRRLLEYFVHEDFARYLDFSSMEPYKTKFVTEAFASRESDVIWKARFRDRDLYLFLLIEFQSTVDRRMPIRLLRYIAEFYDSLPMRPRGGQYPAVFPIVLYNGSVPWTAKTDISELIEYTIPPAYIPSLRYYVIEERSFSAPALLGMRNLVSLLFYAETVPPEELLLSLDSFFDILEVEDAAAVHLFSRWLNDYFRQMAPDLVGSDPVDFESGEDATMLAENFKLWRARVFKEGKEQGLEIGVNAGIEQGIEKGIEKGKQVSTLEIARRLLARGMVPEEVATVAGLSVPELERLLGT